MKSKISIVMLLIMALLMFGCSSDTKNNYENNPSDNTSDTSSLTALTKVPVLFGVTGGGPEARVVKGAYKQPPTYGTSSLYLINTLDGSATLIGDIGYEVESIAYDAITNKLYGITQGGDYEVRASVQDIVQDIISSPQLIEIDMKTGAGTSIGEIMIGSNYTHHHFVNPTFDLLGRLFAYDSYNEAACTIDLTTAVATELSAPTSFSDNYIYGLAFNNLEGLYMIRYAYRNGDWTTLVYTVDITNGEFTELGTIPDLPYGQVWNGDFHPLTGKYWGLDMQPTQSGLQSLVVIDVDNRTLVNTIPTTMSNLSGVTFGYMDLPTLLYYKLTGLFAFFNQEQQPE